MELKKCFKAAELANSLGWQEGKLRNGGTSAAVRLENEGYFWNDESGEWIAPLTDEQVESLTQYANECKMRPNEFPDEWRSVPTSQEEFAQSGEKMVRWLEIANTF